MSSGVRFCPGIRRAADFTNAQAAALRECIDRIVEQRLSKEFGPLSDAMYKHHQRIAFQHMQTKDLAKQNEDLKEQIRAQNEKISALRAMLIELQRSEEEFQALEGEGHLRERTASPPPLLHRPASAPPPRRRGEDADEVTDMFCMEFSASEPQVKLP